MVGITMQGEGTNGRDSYSNGRVITSPKGAKGRMQVLDSTNAAPGFGVSAARDGSLDERARVGRDYLMALHSRYRDPAKTWAAYNWGPGNLDRALSMYGENWLAHAPKETRDYVSRNLAALGG